MQNAKCDRQNAKLKVKISPSVFDIRENIYLCGENRFIHSSRRNAGHKFNRSWLIKLMMIALLVEPASMNVR